MRLNKYNTYFVKSWGNIIHIYDPIFRFNIWYLTVKNFDKAKKALKILGIKHEFKTNNQGGFSVYERFGQEIGIMWTKGSKIDISHECCHATFYILEKSGIPHNVDTDETYAYHQSFLFKCIVGKIQS